MAVLRTASTMAAASDQAAGRFETDTAVGAGHDERASRLLGQVP
jgi:hypothetical protein